MLVFDELHRRVLKIQLIAQPHEKRPKLVLSQSDVPVLCMVSVNDMFSQLHVVPGCTQMKQGSQLLFQDELILDRKSVV